MAFRARKVFGTFEKRAPGPTETTSNSLAALVNSAVVFIFINNQDSTRALIGQELCLDGSI